VTLLLLLGDVGENANVGFPGAVESSTYGTLELEQLETLPAASVAVAYTVVVVLSATVAEMVKSPLPFAVPVATTALVQLEFVYSLTVALPSAVPVKEGVLLLAGEAGDTPVTVGRPGATLSCTYVIALLHTETAPVESVALATRLLEALALTLLDKAKLKFPLPSVVPLPTWPTPQLPRNTLTVVFAGAVPATVGRRLFPGETGVVDVRLGAFGAAAVVKLQLVAARALPATS
jgi:hypothetical protein